MASLLAAGIAGLLALASAGGRYPLLAAVAILQAVLALGVMRSTRVPGAAPGAALGFVVGAAASFSVVLVNDTADLGPAAVAPGLAMVVVIVLELGRAHGRERLVESLALSVTLVLLCTLPVAWVALRAAPGGQEAVRLGLLAVAIVSLSELVPGSRSLVRVIAVLAAAAAATLITRGGSVQDAVAPVDAMALAAFAAVLAAAGVAVVDRITAEAEVPAEPALVPAGRQARREAVHAPQSSTMLLRAGLPLTTAAPVVYLLSRILVG